MDAPTSMQVIDEQAKKVQKTPNRISLEMIKDRVEFVDYIHPERHPHMTICLVTMTNGFVLLGHSAPADPDNFNPRLGEEFSLDQALKQAWPLLAFELRTKMVADAAAQHAEDSMA